MKKTRSNATTTNARKRQSAGERYTSTRLIEAAANEFQERGFTGTDTNRIARRAGFAPQTFYRWFADKTDIFVAVYHAWIREQTDRINGLVQRGASDRELIDAVIAHHRAYYIFRRSLRQLTLEDDRMRKARAESRLEQIQGIKDRSRPSRRSTAEVAIFLLQYERLCDAVADGELDDLGVPESAVRLHLEQLYQRLRRAR